MYDDVPYIRHNTMIQDFSQIIFHEQIKLYQLSKEDKRVSVFCLK